MANTIYKFRLLFRELEAFAQDKGLVFRSDFDVEHPRQFRATWKNENFAAQKKLENLEAFFRHCQRCRLARALTEDQM